MSDSRTELIAGYNLDSFGSADWMADEVANRYFKALEYKAYYESVKRVGPKRDIAEQLLADVLPLFLSSLVPSVRGRVSQLLGVARERQSTDVLGSVIKRAQHLNIKGFKLLDLQAPLTVESLKDAYRRAVKTHHPDVGGDTTLMQTVNEAYSQFHELVCNATYVAETNGPKVAEGCWKDCFRPSTADDFFNGIGLLLMYVATDIMAVDTAYSVFKSITADPKTAMIALHRHIGLLEDMAIRLKAAGMDEASEEIFPHLYEVCGAAVAQGINYAVYTDKVREMDGAKKARIVINHEVQAKHAYRLGMIDKKQYLARMSKFQAAHAREEEQAEILRRFVTEHGFLVVPRRDNVDGGCKSLGLVPEPGYSYVRFQQLTEIQQEEYCSVFAESPDYKQVAKYLHVRVSEYAVEIISHWDETERGRIINECEMLSTVYPDKKCGLALPGLMIRYLERLSQKERSQKLKLLASMDQVEDPRVIFSISMDAMCGKQIEATDEYLGFMSRPYERLVQYKKAGTTTTQEEEVEKAKKVDNWNRDHALITALSNSDLGCAMNHALRDLKTTSPEQVCEALIPYLEAALDLGKKLETMHTGELQLGYKVDKLTAAFVKLKKWAETHHWLKLFFDLPDNYRDRLNFTDERRLRTRLERAKDMITKVEK